MRNIIKNILKEEIDSKSERIKSIVNKYGFEQASEMVVGGKDSIRQIYGNYITFLTQFNNLSPVVRDADTMFERTYYVDEYGKPIFYYEINDTKVYFNYNKFWSYFNEIEFLTSRNVEYILTKWLEQNYKLKGYIPSIKPGSIAGLNLED